jgi:hypothetical protein
MVGWRNMKMNWLEIHRKNLLSLSTTSCGLGDYHETTDI